jgi:hypothetical protein
MSERAIAFVEKWVSENVSAEPNEPDSDESKAAVYAVQCAAEAKEVGIPDSELNDAFESLTAFMSAAIVSATDEERDRSKDN